MKSLLLFTIFLAFSVLESRLRAQDTVFYRHLYEEVSDRNVAKSYKILQYETSDSLKATETTYFMNGQVKQVTPYSNYKKREKHGVETHYYENNRLYSSLSFVNGKEEGKHMVYYRHGSLKREDLYINGKLDKGRCIGLDGKDTTYFAFYKAGEYPGGNDELLKFLAQNVKYPNKAKEQGTRGMVVVSFVVTETGKPINYRIWKSLTPETDAEAMRVSRLIQQFEPSMLDGEIIAAQYHLPFRFSIR